MLLVISTRPVLMLVHFQPIDVVYTSRTTNLSIINTIKLHSCFRSCKNFFCINSSFCQAKFHDSFHSVWPTSSWMNGSADTSESGYWTKSKGQRVMSFSLTASFVNLCWQQNKTEQVNPFPHSWISTFLRSKIIYQKWLLSTKSNEILNIWKNSLRKSVPYS